MSHLVHHTIKLIGKFVSKQSDNQYTILVLIDEQLSILLFCQDDQIGNASYYDHFTTKVEWRQLIRQEYDAITLQNC